ncbi:hypothetical protein LCGC14_1053890 [marine sediment metagenome]|uniref:Restriction endonuclease n=1 Tax=marine sediment metagenome TaxID=412755 RepID=A0A0F9N9U7_9ZZZZ
MKSKIFATNRFEALADRAKEVLNAHEDFLSPTTARSTRAVGDAIQGILGEHFQTILGDECAEYSANFGRRAMEDFAFKDKDGLYYVIDVKTHREDTKFNMPNLTAVWRLARFYEDDTNYFVLLLVKYRLEGTHAAISEVIFVPIEFLDWDCLRIGALGRGQIQIANSNYISLRLHYSRRAWMLELCDAMLEFYPKEIGKIGTRMEHFQKVKERWEAKTE